MCRSDSAWSDYLSWQVTDRRMLKRINRLVEDVQRNGYDGIGKPEALRHQWQGYYSRRISDEHRLIYKNTDIDGAEQIWIVACHYDYEK